MVRALRDFAKAQDEKRAGMTAEQGASYQQLLELGGRFRGKWKYGEPADHSDLYDEHGLPQ